MSHDLLMTWSAGSEPTLGPTEASHLTVTWVHREGGYAQLPTLTSSCRDPPQTWLCHPRLFHPGHQSQLCSHLGLPHALARADLEGMHSLVQAQTTASSRRWGPSFTWEEQGLKTVLGLKG